MNSHPTTSPGKQAPGSGRRPSSIEEAGILAIATRLQRLSEIIRKDGLQIYKDHGIDFEPKWFPVVYTLSKYPLLSVVELASEIGYTHPSTISLLKEMEKEKLIRSKKDKIDERKRLIQLTEKGEVLLSQITPVWNVIIQAVTELTNTPNNLMSAIEEVEARFKEKGLAERARG
jgi:DNA-binding MarR family transcriptional regulator